MTPDGWSLSTVRAVADIVGGFAFPHAHQGRREAEHPFFKVSDMNRDGNERRLMYAENCVDDATLAALRARLYPAGTIVFPKVGAALLTNKRRTLGRIGLFDNNVMGLVPKTIHGEFLPRIMETVDFASMVQPGAVPSVNGTMVGEINLLLPPFEEQRKIAAVLSSVDDAIEATRAVIDQLQVVKKAMMAELLTRGLPGRHTRFKQTEIGEVPEAWDVVRIGDVCERMFVGIAQAATHAYVPEGGVPIIRSTNVRPNRLRKDDVLRISDAFADEMKSKALRGGDVLSARTGYPGTSVVVPAEFHGAQCFTMLVSRPSPRLRAQLLCHLMNSAIGTQIVAHGQAGGAQQNLNVGVFEQAQVALPPLEEQEQICRAIDAVYEREWAEEIVVASLAATKAALMSVLVTGEVRVTPDEQPA
jgi:type I restriction enzyme, S subunit